jgi:predicted P-loop ATPase/GTPase
LKEAEEHSEENETKKAEKLKNVIGKTADKYEETLKRIESENPMQEIWTS